MSDKAENGNGNGNSKSAKEILLDIQRAINESQSRWNKTIADLTNRLKGDLRDSSDIQADTISSRQLVIDEINIYGLKIYKENQKIKKLSKLRFEFYATSYQIKTNGSEKLKLIEADLADRQYLIDLYDNHVNYLRETSKNLDSINYGIKNKIELYNILGGHE